MFRLSQTRTMLMWYMEKLTAAGIFMSRGIPPKPVWLGKWWPLVGLLHGPPLPRLSVSPVFRNERRLSPHPLFGDPIC